MAKAATEAAKTSQSTSNTNIATLIQQLTSATTATNTLNAKFLIATDIVRKLGAGDVNTNIISVNEKLKMYGWYKIARNEALAKEPSNFNVFAHERWEAHKKALSENLDANTCMTNYIQFIVKVMQTYGKEVNEILNPSTSKAAAKPSFLTTLFGKSKKPSTPSPAYSAAMSAIVPLGLNRSTSGSTTTSSMSSATYNSSQESQSSSQSSQDSQDTPDHPMDSSEGKNLTLT